MVRSLNKDFIIVCLFKNKITLVVPLQRYCCEGQTSGYLGTPELTGTYFPGFSPIQTNMPFAIKQGMVRSSVIRVMLKWSWPCGNA